MSGTHVHGTDDLTCPPKHRTSRVKCLVKDTKRQFSTSDSCQYISFVRISSVGLVIEHHEITANLKLSVSVRMWMLLDSIDGFPQWHNYGGGGVGKGDASGGFESGKFPWMVYLVSVYLRACFGTFALNCKGFRLFTGLVFLRHASVMAHHHTPKNDLRGVIFSTPKSSKITHSLIPNTHLQHTWTLRNAICVHSRHF